MRDDDFELARRELCSDDRCIGLVGPDGRCKVCGLVSPSAVADPRYRGLRVTPGEDGAEGAGPAEEERELCPDGTCVGIVGPDGRCKMCGTAAVPGAADAAQAERTTAVAGLEQGEEADDEDRELCPDGTCIGLIGDDGRCKVCGALRSPAAS